MQIFECLDKKRDQNGIVQNLLLVNKDTNQKQWVAKDRLKAAMSQGSVFITNMRIDSSGKLIDCESQKVPKQNNPKQGNSLDTDEVLKYLKQLEESSKDGDTRIIKILRELYIRQNEMGQKLDKLLEGPDDNYSQAEVGVDNLAEYLISNTDKLDDIKKKIENLNNALLNPSSHSDKESKVTQPLRPSNTIDKSNSILLREANGYPKPENPYELERCEGSFMLGRNSLITSNDIDEINTDLNRMYIDTEESGGGFKYNKVPMEVIERLRKEVDKASLAFKYTREEFEYQLTTMIGMHTDLGLLSMVYGVVSDKINEIPGFIGETATGRTGLLSGVSLKKFGYAMKDLSLSVFDRLPGVDHTNVRDKRQAIRFRDKKQLTPSQINDIKNFTDSMWNDAARFVMNDPEWEIKLFVIQFLTKQYTGKYNATNSSKTIQSESGRQLTINDTSLTNKYANRLTEVSLTKICDYILEGRISDKYYLEACNRFFIGYFAAKKVMYSYGLYPFDKASTKKVNGLFIEIVKIACLMLNIAQGTIDGILTEIGAPDSEKRHSARMGKPHRYDWELAKFSEVMPAIDDNGIIE